MKERWPEPTARSLILMSIIFATVSLAVYGLVLSEPVEVALPFALGSNVASLRESHRSASLPE